jgi:hypothetical protein
MPGWVAYTGGKATSELGKGNYRHSRPHPDLQAAMRFVESVFLENGVGR